MKKMKKWHMKQETGFGSREVWGSSLVVEEACSSLDDDIAEFIKKHESLSLDDSEDRKMLGSALKQWVTGRKEWNR